MRSIRIALPLTVVLVGATPVTPRASDRPHHGLYAHLEAGVSRISAKASFGPGGAIAAGGPNLALSVGWSLGSHLVLGAERWDVGAPDTLSGKLPALSVVGWGPKLVIYLAPGSADVYLSATLSVTRCTMTAGQVETSTRNGTGLRLALGKDLQLGESPLAVGVAAQLVLSRNVGDGQPAPTWRTVAFGLNVTVTRN